jgi:hypothetical protein
MGCLTLWLFTSNILGFSLMITTTEKYISLEEYYLLGYNACSPLNVYQRFGGTYCLHLKGSEDEPSL